MPKESSQSILFPDCCRSQIALSKGNLLRCIVSRVPMLLTLLLPEWIEELCKVALTFESVDKILWCDHSNESSQSACTFTWYYLFFKILQNEIREFLCNLPFWPQLAVKGLNSLIPKASSRLFCFSCSRVLMLRASSQRSCPICFVSRVLMLTKSLVPGESSLLSQENLNCASSFPSKQF